MRIRIILILIALLMALAMIPFSACAGEARPEITSIQWSEEKDGVVLAIRKNGIEGNYSIICRYGSVDDPWHGAGGDTLDASDETFEYCWNYAGLIPGETYSFQVTVATPDSETVFSEEKEVKIPISDAESQVKILRCSVPDLSAGKLQAMQEKLLKIYFDEGMEAYDAACNDEYALAVSAEFEAEGMATVQVIAPGGDQKTFTAGTFPLDDHQSDIDDFAWNLATGFVFTLPIEQGEYTVRLYDWEQKCFISSFCFNVNE